MNHAVRITAFCIILILNPKTLLLTNAKITLCGLLQDLLFAEVQKSTSVCSKDAENSL